ncbi:MAG TPA: hypothetical protein VE955_08875, partial [Candidatus Dormibacteraeota bacterium]|nr:hypothetical protein [Candidatus Dormibacteraeota bacterium]
AIEVSPPPTPGSLEPLSKLEGVKGFTSSVDEERGVGRIEVVVETDEAAGMALDFVRKSGMSLISNWRQQTTLEEVFVALVGRGFREREHESSS